MWNRKRLGTHFQKEIHCWYFRNDAASEFGEMLNIRLALIAPKRQSHRSEGWCTFGPCSVNNNKYILTSCLSASICDTTYPKIDDANLKCALWILQNASGISIVLLSMCSKRALLRYGIRFKVLEQEHFMVYAESSRNENEMKSCNYGV